MFILGHLFKRKGSNPRQNHLRFVYLSSSLGGILLGAGVSAYYTQIYTRVQTATWNNDWDKMNFLNEEEEINDSQLKVTIFYSRGASAIFT
jgi:hypothetical protein